MRAPAVVHALMHEQMVSFYGLVTEKLKGHTDGWHQRYAVLRGTALWFYDSEAAFQVPVHIVNL